MTIRSQPDKPLKPSQIVGRRPLSAPRAPVSAFPSSGGTPLTTISPPPKTVLTIVSWNVQKFESSKSLANPYVNGVINQVLASLDADVCILLEARENNAVNLAAIEHKLANPGDHEEDETTEAEWDLKELEDEAADVLRNSELNASLAITYETLSTELTGKRYKPVQRIYLYGNPDKSKFFPKMAKSYSIDPASKKNPVYTGAWKRLYWDSAILQKYYAPYQISTKLPILDLAAVPLTADAEADVVFRLRICSECQFRLGERLDCPACNEYNPYSAASENLRNEIKSCAFTLGGVDLESYAILARPHLIGSYEGSIQMKGKAAQVYRHGCQLLRHKPPPTAPYSAQGRRDAYVFGQGVSGTASDDDKLKAMSADLSRRGVNVKQFGEWAMLNALGVPTTQVPPPSPMNQDARKAWFVSRCQPGTDPGLAFRHAVIAAGGNPDFLSMDAMLNLVKVPDQVLHAAREASHEERLQICAAGLSAQTMEQQLKGSGRNPLVVVFDAGLDQVGFPKTPLVGDLLPYLDPTATTYGRSPFVLPMSAMLSHETVATPFPVVAFHAPYGKDNKDGLTIRVDSLIQLLDADAGNRRRFGDHDDAIIIGDLNLDLTESPTNMMGKAAKRAYDGLASAGFAAAIPKVPSSLKTVFNTKKKKKSDGIYKKYEEVAYQKLSGDVSNFTSSAYDNVLVRGAKLQSKVVTAAVVDVVGWIKDNIASGQIDTAGARAEWPGFASLNAEQQAFFIYRTFVSDHLPVMVDIEVEHLKPEYDLAQQNMQLYRKVVQKRTKIKVTEVHYTDCEYMECCTGATLTTLDGTDAAFYLARIDGIDTGGMSIQLDTGPARISRARRVVGKVQLGGMVAVVRMKGPDPHVLLAVGITSPVEAYTLVNAENSRFLLVGKVEKVSGDGKRVRIVLERFRCILPVLDSCSSQPVVGSYVMAMLKGCSNHDIEMAV